jgi:hypothetical protein
MALRLNDLVINSEKTFKNNFLLADISPSFTYIDGKRSDTQEGWKYTVVLPALKLERLIVKVSNNTPLIDLEKEEIPVGIQVKFDNLVTSAYFSNGNIGISAKADNISFVSSK